MTQTAHRNPVAEELGWLIDRARAPQLRTMRQFAEEEIVIPEGPFEGRRFRSDRQPYTRLWFEAVFSGLWNRFVVTGPTQTGKTLVGFVIPLLYHLFEVGETVICGLPHMEMAGDKWREDIKPVIERSRFKDLLPLRGGGSRGGKVEAIQFRNGATLKFMSGGGSDKSRAGFTSRVLVVTETDGMDESGGTSREADKITQLEARTRAYGSRKRVYLECTVSTDQGRTWREYEAGTKSRIVLPCPHCSGWVSPEREHLGGWQDAETEVEAREAAYFFCPSCREPWTEDQRIAANLRSQLMHRGQEITADGMITGDGPLTDTLGFRWSAAQNLFASAGDVAADEWRASRAADEDNAEREMRQFVWCLPYEPPVWDAAPLNPQSLMSRMGKWPKGLVPEDTEYLTMPVDLGKYLAHWMLIAWRPEGRCHIADYGRHDLATDQLGVEKAMMVALRELKELAETGWAWEGEQKTRVPDQVWIDAGYKPDVVYAFCREAGERFRPTLGRGAGQQRQQFYTRPKTTGSTVRLIDEGYHIVWMKGRRIYVVEIDADHWKSFGHQRLACPIEAPGAMTLFRALPREHTAIARHWTAERQIEEFIAGKGVRIRWERLRRQNHWFDCLYNGCAAGHFCGARLLESEVAAPKSAPPARPQRTGLTMPDGRPYLITERR